MPNSAEDNMPAIYNAVKVEIEAEGTANLTGEISKHLGGGRVRCVALGSTEGLRRGQDCVDTGSPVSVPVGEATLGRVFNMLGETVDGRGPMSRRPKDVPIHQPAPTLKIFPPTPNCLRPESKLSIC